MLQVKNRQVNQSKILPALSLVTLINFLSSASENLFFIKYVYVLK